MIAPEIAAPKRVLIIKPSALGDVATGMPILRGLKRTFPGIYVAWLVNDNCANLIANDSDLDEVIIFHRKLLGRAWRNASAAVALMKLINTLRSRRFDWVIDIQGLFRSGFLAWASGAKVRAGFAGAKELAGTFYTHSIEVEAQHTIDRNIELAVKLGIDARGEDMTLELSPTGQAASDQHGLTRGRYLVVVPPTRWKTKLYPKRHWRKVISALAGKTTVVVLGAPGDEKMCQSIVEGLDGDIKNLAGKTSIEQMVGLIAASRGVICSDSAAKFIAPAVGVDVVCLIGPTRAEQTGPYKRGKVLLAELPCQGCQKRSCRHTSCMEMISPGEVIEAALAM